MKWIPLEDGGFPQPTALEGQPVLLYSTYHDLVEPGEWRGDHWHVWVTHGLPFAEPTHWMPMPEPPLSADGRQE